MQQVKTIMHSQVQDIVRLCVRLWGMRLSYFVNDRHGAGGAVICSWKLLLEITGGNSPSRGKQKLSGGAEKTIMAHFNEIPGVVKCSRDDWNQITLGLSFLPLSIQLEQLPLVSAFLFYHFHEFSVVLLGFFMAVSLRSPYLCCLIIMRVFKRTSQIATFSSIYIAVF